MNKIVMIFIGMLFSFQMLQADEERSVSLEAGYNAVQFDANVTLEELQSKIGIDNLINIQGSGQGTAYKKKYLDIGKPYLNSFSQTEFGEAYWIEVGSAVNFNYTAETYKRTRSIELSAGWNFVGPIAVLSLAEIQTQIGIDNLLIIQGAGQGEAYKIKYVDRPYLNSFTAFEQGEGYWVKVASAATLSFVFELEEIAQDNSSANLEEVKTIGGQDYTIRVYTNYVPNALGNEQKVASGNVANATVSIMVNGEEIIFNLEGTYPSGTKLQIRIFDATGEQVSRTEIIDYEVSMQLSAVTIDTSVPCITREELENKIANNEDVTEVNTSCITDMSELFANNYGFNQDIGNWDVSNVTNMHSMFETTSFNQDISGWDVSNVTDMSSMFLNSSFNQDIGDWNVSNVTNMSNLFEAAESFNQDLGDWNVSNVTTMNSMFMYAPSNYDLGDWDVSNVTTMRSMFQDTPFNQDIGDWNVSNVTEMFAMFAGTPFNHDIGDWDVSNVISMRSMFSSSDFNQDISSWDTSSVLTMDYMFAGTTNFQQNINDWNVSNVLSMRSVFVRSSFNQDISAWDVSNVTNMHYMFKESSFDQDIGDWNVSNVITMNEMFKDTTLSVDNYDALLNGWSQQALKLDVNFHGGNSQYSSNASTARQQILDTYGWTITDGGQEPTARELAQAKIEAYATDSSNPVPTLQDYIDAGVVGVTVENLDAVNSAVDAAQSEDVDTVEELNALVGGLNNPPFVTTWKTDNIGGTEDNQIQISTIGEGYNYSVDWGDGSSDDNVDGNITHTYASAGTYSVSISGDFPRIYFGSGDLYTFDVMKLLSVESWGTNQWTSMHRAFAGCSNLVINATDVPDLSNVTDMSYMFARAIDFNSDISSWDVSNVTDMKYMFDVAQKFNQSLDDWDVSSVTNMDGMFSGTSKFNQTISSWNVSSVTSMKYMFIEAFEFNQPLDDWDVSNVEYMTGMFVQASDFNQNLDSWNVSNLKDASYMFRQARSFNGAISSWDVSSVTNMKEMLYVASSFNQDIGSWNVANAIDMSAMFYGTTVFNQDIGNWDVSSVTNMYRMFRNSTSFDQDLSSWNVSNVSNMMQMFNGITLSVDNYSSLLNGWSQLILQPDVSFDGGESKYNSSASSARADIIDNYNWDITDGGLELTVQETAQAVIEAYATDSSNPVPTLQDYIDAGVVGVTVENLDAVNSAVDAAQSEDVDTVEELNVLVETINNDSGADLLINEVSGAYYSNDSRWFEIYNASSNDVDLSTYTLKSIYYDGTNSGTFEFSLPSKMIPAGGYLIVHSNYGPALDRTMADIENDTVIYLKDTASTKYPYWSSSGNGFLELLKAGETVDFLTFGAAYTPTTDTAWSGVYVPSFSSDSWKSIGRNSSSTDSNTFSDWTERSFQTYAALNDVTCNDDADEDGIPDCSEVSGSTYAGLDLYGFGARVNQKDIFIEVDYIDSTNGGTLELDEGTVPHQRALEKVKASFAANGYAVHFDVGNLFSQNGDTLDPSQMDLGGGNQVDYSLAVNLGCTDAGINAREYKVENMQVQRKQIFYYMLFGTSQNSDGSSGSSGCAESPGNDSLMTLGGWNLSTSSEQNTNTLINFQAGTVMHEFGHNLGLGHGGDEPKNYKPNYISVMNYLYQLQGLPTIGDNEGDRYYSNYGACSNLDTGRSNPFWGDPDDFILDYSHGNGSTLDEVNGVLEENGLGQSNSGHVDFNCNGTNDDFLTNYNLNASGDTVIDTLEDHDDWGSLNIIFSRTYCGNSGITNHTLSNEAPIVNPLADDIQPVISEEDLEIPSMGH